MKKLVQGIVKHTPVDGVPYRGRTQWEGHGPVRFGRVQLALYKIDWLDGHTAVLIIQGAQNSDTIH
jgi:hypothetical protein